MAREPRIDSRDETREPEGRRKRVPLGAPLPRLHADHRPGYVRRFINDTPGRLDRAKQAGYANVEEDGETRKVLVGTTEQGGPLYAYLMEQEEGFYNEDQAAKEAQNSLVDEAIRRGGHAPAVKPDSRDAAQFYGQGNISSGSR